MTKKVFKQFSLVCIFTLLIPCTANAQTVGLFYDSSVDQISFAAADIKTALESNGFTVETPPLSSLNTGYANKKVVLALASNTAVTSVLTSQGGTIPTGLGEQGYGLRTTSSPEKSYWVIAGDANGAMYGGLQIAENITAKSYTGTYNEQEAPYMLNRGMKLNMPLDRRIPTYVGGWSSRSAKKAIPHVWDISFWKDLIDQQARYRYNMLSVWVHHPFPALVKLTDYPNASLPRIEGFDGFVLELDHNERVAFWREVMQYAHSRGMSFYFFNWNVYVDYAMDQYPSIEKNQTSTVTKDYMYKSMQALIDTYPELDGFGVSTGDGMEGTETDKTTWSWDCYGKAVKDYLTAHPARKFDLIHRSIGTNPELFYSTYAPLQTVSNATVDFSIKYAMAHMYSTPTPTWTADMTSTVFNTNKTWITVRNDDYFYINWGDHQFVRDFMNGITNKQAVKGMYIGSDGYNPSRTYLYKDNALNGQLEVERRWYMEMLWGRLAYNPSTNDEVFKQMLAKRFPSASAENLFNAWTLASRPLPKMTELIMADWNLDFDWWPEACWSDPGRGTGFRVIGDMAEQDVAQGSTLCNFANSATNNCGGKKSTYTVADEMQADADNAIALADAMSSSGNTDLDIAIKNIKQMAYLSNYYACKVRGATYKKAGNTVAARNAMASAYCYWKSYAKAMGEMYVGDSMRNVEIYPDWKFADAAVLKEYTDLGGVGNPICGTTSYTATLTSIDTNKGTVSGSGVFNPDDEVLAVAVPKSGYRFLYWKENNVVVSSDLQYTFTISSDRVLVAHFVAVNACAFPWTDPGVTVNKATVNKTYGPIDISCATNGVKINIETQGVGTDNSDYCRVYYRINGGAQIPIVDLQSAFAFRKDSVLNITGNQLEIIISSKNSFNDEFYYINNIKVTENILVDIDLIEDVEDFISIYPNPTSDILQVECKNATISKLELIDLSGKLLFAKSNPSKKESIDLSGFLNGWYILKLYTSDYVYTSKVIKQ